MDKLDIEFASDQERDYFAQAKLGEDVIGFLRTPVGRYLHGCAKQEIEQLKKELAATQKDVEIELVKLRDADLAHLISLGGWIRALEVATVAVDNQFSPERAAKVMREDIADYYTEIVAGLEPRISERPSYLEMRDLLSGLRHEMVIAEGQEATPEKVKEIREQAGKLVELALLRKE